MNQVSLRKLTFEDCTPKYLGWIKDESNRKYISTLKSINTLSELKASTKPRLSDNNYSIVGIFFQDEHIGNVQVRLISENEYIISILIGEKEFRGKGIAKHTLCKFLNTKSLLPKCKGEMLYYAAINIGNIASQKLFSSVGFEEVEINNWPNYINLDQNTSKLYLLCKSYASC